MEEWRAIEGYEGFYEVSNFGSVRSIARTVEIWRGHTMYYRFFPEKVLKPIPDTVDHLVVFLSRESRKDTRRVHSLVATAFIGPRPEGKGACHRDDVKTNNCVDNLYYGTQQENMDDCGRNGNRAVGEKSGRSPLTERDVLEIRRLHGKITLREIGEMFSVSHQSVGAIVFRRTWRHLPPEAA